MKNKNILAVALSAGLVLGVTAPAHAAEPNEDNWYGTSYEEEWENAATELENETSETEEVEEDATWDGYEDPYTKAWEDAAKELENETSETEEVEEDATWDGYEDPYTKAWEDAAEEFDKNNQTDSDKLVTIDEWNLNNAKDEAIKALKEAGVTSDFFLNQIRNAKTIEGVESLKSDLLKSHKDSAKADPDKLTTIDDWNLKNAKEDAIKELKEAGITSDFFLNQIRKAKTIEGVEALKNELLNSRKEDKKSIPWTELEPSNPKKLGEDDKEIVVPSPVLPEDEEDKKDDSVVVVPEEDKEEKEEDKEDTTTSKEVDDLIKEIEDRDQEIREELKRIDSTVVVDDNKKPADEDKKPVETDKDKKEDDAEAQPSKDKVVVKEIIKDVKEAVRVPAASHNNPKTGVADLSAVAGTLAISMAGIVATRKKND